MAYFILIWTGLNLGPDATTGSTTDYQTTSAKTNHSRAFNYS